MVNTTNAPLLNVPIELVFRILDHLASEDILVSVREVCQRLNYITDVYHPYQVIKIIVSTCSLIRIASFVHR